MRYRYPAIVSEDEEGILIKFPDVPCAMTRVDEPEEIVPAARSVLGESLLWLAMSQQELPVATYPPVCVLSQPEDDVVARLDKIYGYSDGA